MADFYGMSRTNYFEVEGNPQDLISKFERLGFTAFISDRGKNEGKFIAYREDMYPYFSTEIALQNPEDPDFEHLREEATPDGYVCVDLVEETALHLPDGVVAMFGTWGNEKARYGSGIMEAVVKHDGVIHREVITAETAMMEIIKDKWGEMVDVSNIGDMCY